MNGALASQFLAAVDCFSLLIEVILKLIEVILKRPDLQRRPFLPRPPRSQFPFHRRFRPAKAHSFVPITVSYAWLSVFENGFASASGIICKYIRQTRDRLNKPNVASWLRLHSCRTGGGHSLQRCRMALSAHASS
jgi:hypothetical protein